MAPLHPRGMGALKPGKRSVSFQVDADLHKRLRIHLATVEADLEQVMVPLIEDHLLAKPTGDKVLQLTMSAEHYGRLEKIAQEQSCSPYVFITTVLNAAAKEAEIRALIGPRVFAYLRKKYEAAVAKEVARVRAKAAPETKEPDATPAKE